MRSVVGSNDSLVVEFWHPFDEQFGGKDMAAVHLHVARSMVLDVSYFTYNRQYLILGVV